MLPNAMQNSNPDHSVIPTLANCVQDLISAYPDSGGARALQVLLRHPNQSIHSINLTHMIDPPDYTSLNSFSTLELAPEINPFEAISKIPMTDHQAVREVYNRMNSLVRQKADIQSLSDSVNTAAINAEISALKKYLSECQRPGGKIRNCNDDERKAYQRISVAVKRLLEKAENEHPEAVAIVRKNLSMGTYFRYLE